MGGRSYAFVVYTRCRCAEQFVIIKAYEPGTVCSLMLCVSSAFSLFFSLVSVDDYLDL